MPRRLIDPEWQYRKLPIIMGIGAALAVGVLVVTLILWVDNNGVSNREAQDFRHAIAENCDRENSTRAAVRRVLTLAQDVSLHNPRLTAAQKDETVSFYTSALKLVPLIDCGSITADSSGR